MAKCYNNQANGMNILAKLLINIKVKCLTTRKLLSMRGAVSISQSAFEEQTKRTYVIIPTSVKSIGKAFSGCTGLNQITYNGTKSQFNAIEKSYSWNDVGISKVICTDGEIALD